MASLPLIYTYIQFGFLSDTLYSCAPPGERRVHFTTGDGAMPMQCTAFFVVVVVEVEDISLSAAKSEIFFFSLPYRNVSIPV